MKKKNIIAAVVILLSGLLLLASCAGGEQTAFPAENTPGTADRTNGSADNGGTPNADGTPVPQGPSAVPQIYVSKLIAYNEFLVSGICGDGATVTVTGGADTVSVRTDAGCFLAVVPVEAGQSYTLSVAAQEPGREPSDAVTVEAEGGRQGREYITDYGDSTVVVGDAYQCMFRECIDDFTGAKSISAKTSSSLASNFKKKVDQIKAKVIVAVVPDPSTVYPENVPAAFQPGETTYRQQFVEALKDTGATVLDLTDVLTAHKNDELKIYQKTDSHWTQYGAYLGYTEIMNFIARDFPDAAPRGTDEITFENRWCLGGDMAYYLDIMNGSFDYWDVGTGRDYSAVSQYNLLPEYTCFALMNFAAPTDETLYWDNSCRSYFKNVEHDHEVINSVSGGNLPSAYIIRDSFSNQLYNMINERFSKVTWESMWSYRVSTSDINDANPDYVIIICSERVLGDVANQFASGGKRNK